jgi:hypothetical protein
MPSHAYLVLGTQQETRLSPWAVLHIQLLMPLVPMASERNEWSAQVVEAVEVVGRLQGVLSHMLQLGQGERCIRTLC